MVSAPRAESRIVLINVPDRSFFRQARSIRRTASPFWDPLPEYPAIDEAYALEVSVSLRTSRMPTIPLSDTKACLLCYKGVGICTPVLLYSIVLQSVFKRYSVHNARSWI